MSENIILGSNNDEVEVLLTSKDIREFRQRRRRPQRERHKINRFRQGKQQLCTCITLFCTFLCRRCTTATWNCLFSRFLEDGNKRQQFAFSFPELWRSPLEFNSKKFAYIWRIEGGGISAIKFEAAQIHFLREQSGSKHTSLISTLSLRYLAKISFNQVTVLSSKTVYEFLDDFFECFWCVKFRRGRGEGGGDVWNLEEKGKYWIRGLSVIVSWGC